MLTVQYSSDSNQFDIHEAAFSGDIRSLKRIVDNSNEIQQFLCLNKKDEAGHTALHKAAMNGWLNCVEYLVEQGAQVNIPDEAGCTPLHLAASNGYVNISHFLVEKGHADLGHKTKKGNTPRQMAKCRGRTYVLALFNDLESRFGSLRSSY